MIFYPAYETRKWIQSTFANCKALMENIFFKSAFTRKAAD